MHSADIYGDRKYGRRKTFKNIINSVLEAWSLRICDTSNGQAEREVWISIGGAITN